jgi:N-acetylated-alpha-linked acidic dipeptidase
MKGAHRLQTHDESNVLILDSLPSIPVQPIGYNDARSILKHLGGKDPPFGWNGRLSVEYKLGGEFIPTSNGASSSVQRARITVNNELVRADVSNIIGVMRGAVEPDRYVIVGGHRDAWGYGAVDPATATAAVVMLAKSFASVAKKTGNHSFNSDINKISK